MENHNQMNQETPNINSEHVKEDFYKWFESRGLLPELKAHMRQLMFKALQDSGKSLRTRKASASPKLQAVNLLIVDYLFHEDYLYTVSVFASEAQIMDSLPQYSCYVTQTVRGDPSALPRFCPQQAEDILDTLRLPPSPSQVREALALYQAGTESLLTCVVRTIAATVWQEQEVEVELEVDQRPWSMQMQQLLLQGGVKLQHIRRMQLKWTQTLEEERQRAMQEAEKRVKEELEAEQQLLSEQRSRVEQREQGLAELAGQLKAVHEDITDRMSHLQEQRQELEVWEGRQQRDRLKLRERLSQLRLREQHTQASVQVQTQPMPTVQQAVETSVKPTVDVECGTDSVSTKEALIQTESAVGVTVYSQTVAQVQTQTCSACDQQTQTCLDLPDPQLITQLQTDRERISELQEENLELRAHILQQRRRIDELTNRAADLASQLEDSRVAVSVLSGRNSAIVSPRPPPPPVFAPQFGYNSPQRQGAGEESMFGLRPQQLPPGPDERRRPQRFAFSQNRTPTSEESNSTDEVVRMARTRIQQLEQESSAIQRHYQAFQNRLFTTDSVMFPPLRSPRVHDPLWRVRQNDVTSFTPFSHPHHPNPMHHPTRSRATQVQADNEESSSDALHEVDIEHLTNTRRMFSHRNIRHFERWKQFKKKFHRHTADHNRHSQKVITSSEDDEERDVRNARQKEVRRKNASGSQNISSVTQKQFESGKKTTDLHNVTGSTKDTPSMCKKDYRPSKKNTVDDTPTQNEITNVQENFNYVKDKAKNMLKSKSKSDISNDESDHEERLQFGMNISEELIENNSMNKNNNASNTSIVKEDIIKSKPNSDVSIVHKSEQEERLRLGMERSEKLIESVKILLGEKVALMPIPSNGSLDVESLPRDSDNGSHNEVAQTENSSVLTVQSVRPASNCSQSQVDQAPRGLADLPTIYPQSTCQEVATVDLVKESSNNKDMEMGDNVQDNTSLVVPTVQLVPSGLNFPGEETIAAICTSVPGGNTIVCQEYESDASTRYSSSINSDISLDNISPRQIQANMKLYETSSSSSRIPLYGPVEPPVCKITEVEGGEPSVTSGRDILRELNPSRTQSSESPLSVGLSRHSDQFWD